jgi:predicted Zn-dependent protease with MMP-like domain
MAAERSDPFTDTSVHTDSGADAGVAPPARGEPDYYAALGLRPGATGDEVRRAFHRLAKLWHPDRYMTAAPELRARAERRMRALTAAHDVLGDPIRRRAYDLRHGYAAADPSFAGWPSTSAAGHAADHTYDASRRATRPRSYVAAAYNTRGAGMFLALIVGIPALSILIYALTHANGGLGSSVGLVVAVMLFGVAAWCLTDDSTLARLAAQWMEGDPAPPADPAPDMADASASADPVTARPGFAPPPDTPFERLVDEALASVPAEFQAYCENVAVRVQAEPTDEELRTLHVDEGGTLFGLYHGVDLTRQGVAGASPQEITIYQGPMERFCEGDPDAMREQVRRTVLHELAHHFGIDHDDMPDWVR